MLRPFRDLAVGDIFRARGYNDRPSARAYAKTSYIFLDSGLQNAVSEDGENTRFGLRELVIPETSKKADF